MIDTIRPVCPCPIRISKRGFIFTLPRPDCPSKMCQELQLRYYAITAMLVQSN